MEQVYNNSKKQFGLSFQNHLHVLQLKPVLFKQLEVIFYIYIYI